MDSNEPTPWEEINPMTVSARRPAPLPACSERLRPASQERFRDELSGCLALTAPVGMAEEARAEWLAVAWATVGHLPDDLLTEGCIHARKVADHPSKIVPAIIARTDERLAERRRVEASIRDTNTARLPSPDYCTPAQAAEILEQYGLKRNWSE